MHTLHTCITYITLHSLHYITLHYIALHYITFHSIPLHYITLHYSTVQYSTVHYSTLHYITLHYITLHYTTLHYSTEQYITVHYITLHYIHTYIPTYLHTYTHTHIEGPVQDWTATSASKARWPPKPLKRGAGQNLSAGAYFQAKPRASTPGKELYKPEPLHPGNLSASDILLRTVKFTKRRGFTAFQDACAERR